MGKGACRSTNACACFSQWQFNTFVDNQSGTWCGIWSDYMPARPIEEQEAEGTVDLKLVNTYKGRQVCGVQKSI